MIVHVGISAPNFVWTSNPNVATKKPKKLMPKAKMLHIQCMSIASMDKQFLSNNGTKDVYINLDITQKKYNKVKIANLKQARDMAAIFEKEFKMEVNLILGI